MDDAAYGPDELIILSDADHVRQRPRMYLGDIDFSRSANCLARESLCLAIDQLIAKTCSRLEIAIQSNGSFSAEHNGIPLGIERLDKYDGKADCEMVAASLAFCQLRADSEFVSANICSISLSVVNFLSEFFRIDNYHEAGHYAVDFAFGRTAEGLKRIGRADHRGVRIEFKLDSSILGETTFDLNELREWFTGLSLDTSHAEIQWHDFR